MQKLIKNSFNISSVLLRENFASKFGLPGISSGFISIHHRAISNLTSDEEKLVKNAVVKKIEITEQGPLLLVEHEDVKENVVKECMKLLKGKEEALPIKIAGAYIDGNGVSWLQWVTLGKKIKFVPLHRSESKFYAKVFLVEEKKADLDIGRVLIGLGFGRPAPFNHQLESNVDTKILESYIRQLKRSEQRAKALRKGLWSFTPESWLRWKIRTTVEKIVFRMKPVEKQIPALIR